MAWKGRRGVTAAVALAAVLLAGCGDDDSGATGNASPAGLTYGYAPVRDGSVTYQPDVVFVGGGPEAVRSASADGLVWTIDGNAPGASDLRVGSIMCATSRAVGRVLDVHKVGGDLAVTLSPVTLTDVFRDAHFVSDRELSPASMVYQEIPEQPAAVTQPAGFAPIRESVGSAFMRVPPIRLDARAGGSLPPSRNTSLAVTVGDWQAQPYFTSSKLGLKIAYKANDDLKVNLDFAMLISQLKVRTNVNIANGAIGSGSTFALDGITGIAVNVAAGAANGSKDNKRIRIEVPVEMVLPIPVSHWSTSPRGSSSSVRRSAATTPP